MEILEELVSEYPPPGFVSEAFRLANQNTNEVVLIAIEMIATKDRPAQAIHDDPMNDEWLRVNAIITEWDYNGDIESSDGWSEFFSEYEWRGQTSICVDATEDDDDDY